MRNNKGQNVVEYILLVTAVLLVCIYFLTSGMMSNRVSIGLNSVVNEINTANSLIQL